MEQALPRPEGLPWPKAKLVPASNDRNPSSALLFPRAQFSLPFAILDLKLCLLEGTSWLQLLFPTLLMVFISLNDDSGIATFVFSGFTQDSVWQCCVTLTGKKGFWCSEGPSCAPACAHWSCHWAPPAASSGQGQSQRSCWSPGNLEFGVLLYSNTYELRWRISGVVFVLLLHESG